MKALRIAGKVMLWLITIFIGLGLVFVGQAKFTRPEFWGVWFPRWGYADWFMWVIGAGEVLGGLLLFVPRTAAYGAAILIVIMLGALYTVTTNESGGLTAGALK